MDSSELNATDLILVLLLAATFLLGFVAGFLRVLLALAGWLVAFLLAAHLRAPVGGWLGGQWRELAPEYSEMIAFGFLFLILFIGSLLLIQLGYRKSVRLVNYPMVDEFLGGMLAVVVGLLVVSAVVVALDTFYELQRPVLQNEVDWIGQLDDLLSDSAVANRLRESLVPVLGDLLAP
ncbi:MAG: CvpA family protein, partial [Chloroflexi bacterium]|nr:CvpA family protein [Chloroflexota bacterium]